MVNCFTVSNPFSQLSIVGNFVGAILADKVSCFSVAWWSFTFLMTSALVAIINYAEHVPSALSQGLALTYRAI
ncbi:hypothetical protein AB3S75_000001 [Citrus x aurantiifolia]